MGSKNPTDGYGLNATTEEFTMLLDWYMYTVIIEVLTSRSETIFDWQKQKHQRHS